MTNLHSAVFEQIMAQFIGENWRAKLAREAAIESNNPKHICYLNRKPYRDKKGILRVRRNCSMNCTPHAKPCRLEKQPIGEALE